MLFISAEDFFEQAKNYTRLTREEEKRLAQQMKQDADARTQLIRSYYPFVAAKILHAPKNLQTLKTVYACLASLEQAVDSFDFLQDRQPFLHHLSWRMRQCITRCLVYRD